MDNVNVRLSTTCPLCLTGKPQGLVACWRCYHAFGLRYGNPLAEAKITTRDAELSGACEG